MSQGQLNHQVTKVLTSMVFMLILFAAGCSGSPAQTDPADGIPALIQTPTLPPSLAGTPLPLSMKGYELYSWQRNDQWFFTLITGTNRNKTLEEITSDENILTGEGWVKITVQGVEAIKTVLSQLPSQESIFWIGTPGPGPAPSEGISLTLPPQEIIDSLQEYCQQLGLELQVSN